METGLQLAQTHQRVQLRLDFRQRLDVVGLKIVAIPAADVAAAQNVQHCVRNRLRCPGKLHRSVFHAVTFPLGKRSCCRFRIRQPQKLAAPRKNVISHSGGLHQRDGLVEEILRPPDLQRVFQG